MFVLFNVLISGAFGGKKCGFIPPGSEMINGFVKENITEYKPIDVCTAVFATSYGPEWSMSEWICNQNGTQCVRYDNQSYPLDLSYCQTKTYDQGLEIIVYHGIQYLDCVGWQLIQYPNDDCTGKETYGEVVYNPFLENECRNETIYPNRIVSAMDVCQHNLPYTLMWNTYTDCKTKAAYNDSFSWNGCITNTTLALIDGYNPCT